MNKDNVKIEEQRIRWYKFMDEVVQEESIKQLSWGQMTYFMILLENYNLANEILDKRKN